MGGVSLEGGGGGEGDIEDGGGDEFGGIVG